MNRHEAYRVASSTLESLQQLTFDELTDFIGERIVSRSPNSDGSEWIVESHISRINDKSLQLQVTVDASSVGPMSRIEESVVLRLR